MGLIKLAVYGALGYVAYQIYQGVVRESQQQTGSGGRPAPQRRAPEAPQADTARQTPQVMTGPARGVEVETHGPSGMSMSHRVGRGVVTRGDA